MTAVDVWGRVDELANGTGGAACKVIRIYEAEGILRLPRRIESEVPPVYSNEDISSRKCHLTSNRASIGC